MDGLSRSPRPEETFEGQYHQHDQQQPDERERDREREKDDRGRVQQKKGHGQHLANLMDSMRPGAVKRRSSSRKARQQKLDLNFELDTGVVEYSPPLYETFHRQQQQQNQQPKRTTSVAAAVEGHTHSYSRSQSYNSHPYANPDAHGHGRSSRTLQYASPPASSKPTTSKYASARALYACRVIHACEPPDGVSYHGLPFFRLELGDVFDILKEAGHPSVHEDLPLYVDDGDDCLLLARETSGAGRLGGCWRAFCILLID